MRLTVLFENRDLIVCLKPAGVLSEAPQHGEPSMLSLLQVYFDDSEAACAPFPVHRLDMGTGGVMVYAKNKKTAAALSAAIAAHETEKRYFAVVHGIPPEKTGVFCDLLFRQQSTGKAFVVSRMRQGVREAQLSYRLLETVGCGEDTLSLVLIRLKTGRFHQIRVQFSSRGMPLAGDGKYGARDRLKHPALWACGLSFDYRGKRLRFSEPPPEELPWTLFSAAARECRNVFDLFSEEEGTGLPR